eukprot:8485-Pelagomonas_calceolata.AAC.1
MRISQKLRKHLQIGILQNLAVFAGLALHSSLLHLLHPAEHFGKHFSLLPPGRLQVLQGRQKVLCPYLLFRPDCHQHQAQNAGACPPPHLVP